MKTTLLTSLCVALFFLYSPSGRAQDLTYLQGIQDKIGGAMGEAFSGGSVASLDSILLTLKSITPQNNMVKQWTAYALMNKTLYLLKTGSREEITPVVKEGIALMNGLEKKNSEDYALLAALQSLATSTLQGMQAGMMAGTAAENAERSRQLDSTNLRAWYVLGSLDYYTPAMYGGGKKAEAYLLKGLSCQDQQFPNPYFPSWGREQIYLLLIALYQDRGNSARASELLEQAKAAYPNNPMWGQYEERGK